MRYLIACILKDSVLEFHEKLLDEVCSEFDVRRQKLPAHFTLKSPFEAKDISDVEKAVEKITVAAKEVLTIVIEGFGHFGTAVIYMKVKPSDEAISIYDKLIMELRTIPWLTWSHNDGEAGKEKSFHCTVVTKLKEYKFWPIWRYVNKYNPYYSINFDNISILKWEEEKNLWTIYKEFKF
jgi:2'-5' RNA ligase